MIYESNGIYYLKSGNRYKIANISIKYNKNKKRNIIVVASSNEYIDNIEEPITEYTFKQLEDKIIGGIDGATN